MIYHTKILVLSLLSGSLLLGCTNNPPAPNLSAAQLKAQRDYTNKLQQQDRDRDHLQRMRRATAISRANKNGGGWYGGGYYNPYYYSSELSDITME
jgi:hypothetical protein